MMRSDLVFALVVGIVLILLVILSRRLYRGDKATPIVTKPPRIKRDPKPFAGLTRQPDCPVCEQEGVFCISPRGGTFQKYVLDIAEG